MKKNEPPVVVEQEFDRSVSDVWRAISDIGEMKQWYFENIPDFKAEVGFSTRFAVESGGRSFLHIWKVMEATPPHRLVYDWTFEGIPGYASVAFEVEGDERSARLRVIDTVTEDFPDDIPEFKRESCLGGWTFFINERLKAYLNGK